MISDGAISRFTGEIMPTVLGIVGDSIGTFMVKRAAES